MKSKMAKITSMVVVLILALTMMAGCGGKEVSPPETAVPRTETLTIYHAGSLAVPFSELETEFEKNHPAVDVLRESGGSAKIINKAITREQAGESPPDIIASADYTLIPNRLYEPGYANWNIIFARNKMALCYRDGAPFADEIASGARAWYEVLRNEDVTWGHSNPDDDPCGYRTPMVVQLAQKYYHDEADTFGVPSDPNAIGLYDALVPGGEHERGRVSKGKEMVRSKSVELVALLQSGDLDYAFEYSSVAVQHGLKFIELDDAINLSQTGSIGSSGITYEEFYKKASIDIVKTPGPPPTYATKAGKPIVYGITITRNAPNKEMAAEFIALLLSAQGREVLEVKNGQPCVVPARCDQIGNLPSSLASLVVAEAPAEATALTLLSGEKSRELTLSAVKAMAAADGWSGRIRSTGDIEGPFNYKGAPLQDLCDLVGGITPAQVVRVIARDGYAMTFSYKQITEGDFITCDQTSGKEVSHGKLEAVLAYEGDGKPLSEKDGPLRLCIVGADKLVTDGHWHIKWVEKVEIKAAPKDWSLHLEGAITEDMDMASFESGAAPNCHGTKWVDGEGGKWKGIPLWLLAGRVDDEVSHGDNAFNTALADSGYEVKVTALDEYSTTFTSAEIKRNNDIIVAYKLNGEPLPEKCWPLRLVGPGLQGNQMVGQIARIEIILP